MRLRCTAPQEQPKAWHDGNELTVSWRNHDEAVGFQVSVVPDDGTPLDSGAVNVRDTSYTFAGLSDGRYRYSVRKLCHYATSSYDTIVYSDWAPAQQLTVSNAGLTAPTGLPFRLAPNPTSGPVTLELRRPAEEGTMLSLLDPAGRLLATLPVPAGTQRLALDLATLPAAAPLTDGLYILRLTSPSSTSARKVLLSRPR